MPVDEVLDVPIDLGVDPPGGSGIELEAFFFVALDCADLDLLAGDGAVDFEGGWLGDGLGGEVAFGSRDQGERVLEVVVRSEVTPGG